MINFIIATNSKQEQEADKLIRNRGKAGCMNEVIPTAPLSDDADPLVKRFAAQLVTVVGNTTPSEHTKRAYERGARDFLDWWMREGCPELSRALVQAYVEALRQLGRTPSTINQRLAAIRKLAREAAENGWLDEQRARGIEGIRGEKAEGTRTGKWLTKHQAQALLDAPDLTTKKGLRDRAILAVLVGCGLRREELTHLTVAHVQKRDGAWAIVDLRGKRGKMGSIPMAGWVKLAL